ncbi:MAG: hypothetical protein Q8P59_09940 [Dehalococcoidia bacterium]|nr:hypothetical protein [Dehalococcoidia bacterium]
MPNFNAAKAEEQIASKAQALNRFSSNRFVHHWNNQLRDDAVKALSFATECDLPGTLRAATMLGMDIGEHEEVLARHIENPMDGGLIRKGRDDLLRLTEDLIVEAMTANCGCRSGHDNA